jgi:transcriptional regulator with XRE-family HTH domain
MNSKNKSKELQQQFAKLFADGTEEQKLDLEAKVLMAGFLSEIERIQEISTNLKNRKSLAEAIGTSPSYLTQVFCGDKNLNFLTLAKIQKVLNIRFEILAHEKIKSLPKKKISTKKRSLVREKRTMVGGQ